MGEGRKQEPYEEATVETPTEFTGACVDLLGSRNGQMLDMQANDVAGTTTIKYRMPTRGLIGLRNAMLTASKGNAVLNTIFDGYGDFSGEINTRVTSSLMRPRPRRQRMCAPMLKSRCLWPRPRSSLSATASSTSSPTNSWR